MKTYITFGSAHTHVIDGVVFDQDCVAIVEGGRARAFELFGPVWSFEYPEGTWKPEDIRLFPRGYINI